MSDDRDTRPARPCVPSASDRQPHGLISPVPAGNGAGQGTGVVWLVGAGPGDPGLITVRGLRCIQQADVVVHDALVDPRLLARAAPECEVIPAGKRAGRHSMSQEATNELLARLASHGRRVCRLKGGDPFVFGRGGEEARFLRERGIRFEVVPGVTSATAVPAYAGIPVTMRGISASLHVVTAREDAGKPGGAVDWELLAREPGTVVCLMGHRLVREVAERLVAAGRAAATPAAVISNGTLGSQQTVCGTLDTIAADVEAAGLPAPATLVVGEVVLQRDALAWFERKPLAGRRLVVTRPRAQSAELIDILTDAGAEVIAAPAIRIESLAGTPEMRQLAARLGDVDWVVFTSAAGVDALFTAITASGRDARALGGVHVAAIGPATAARLRCHGVVADVVPPRYTSESLAGALAATGKIAGRRVAWPRADIAPVALGERLRQAGGNVIETVAYRTIFEPALPDGLADQLAAGGLDLVLFTSASTVRGFAQALPPEGRTACLAAVRAASIGPETSRALREAGITIAVEAAESTVSGLARAVIEHAWTTRITPTPQE